MPPQDRIGFVAASGYVAVGIAYSVAVGFGVAQAGLDQPIVDPVLWVMELITLGAAPLILVLVAAIHAIADPQRKVYGVIAVAFAAAFAALTCAVHFAALTAGRQVGFTVLEWPSVSYAVELLAWDVFLGLALLFAGAVFAGPGREALIRRLMWISGGLCLVGIVGPATGNMALQRPGMLGYGIVLPITCVLLAIRFRDGGPARGR